MKQSKSQHTLISTAETLLAASAHDVPLAQFVYRMGNGPRLHRAPSPSVPRGGLMMIGEDDFDGIGDVGGFCRQVLGECSAKQFQGVVLDLESSPSPAITRMIPLLEEQLRRRSLSLTLSENYGAFSEKARVMISSAISGGSLEKRLSEAVALHSASRVAVCIQPVCEEFPLPALQGSGKFLDRKSLQQRIKQLEPSIFFSEELYAHYFSYLSRDSGGHFILFDDATSIRRKVTLAEGMGIQHFFYFYPEVVDFLPDLIGQL